MNDQPIGILDSGVGGLSVWREIVKLLPNESTIYLADSLNCPYGTKKEEEIYKLAKGLISFLLEKKAKLIVVACNTITVTCLDKLRIDFPNTPIIGTVPVIKTAANVSKNKKIGVLSTERTAQSLYQKNLIDKFANGCKVVTVGTGKLVPYVETGEIDGKKVTEVVSKALKPFIENNVDAIALGCSHFPFLRNIIQKIVGEKVMVLDSSGAIARQTQRVLVANNSLSSPINPNHLFYTTGDKKQFIKVYKKLLGDKISKLVEFTEKVVIGESWKGKKIAILGLGTEGISSAKFFIGKGEVTVLDRKLEKEFDFKILKDLKKFGVRFVFGKGYLDNLNFDIIVKSPGIKLDTKELQKAKERGIVVTSQTKIFFDLCPCPIIGVTGTKGKGTTATLIYEMLIAQGFDAYLGGNIGEPPLNFLDKLNTQSKVILELSSFQLFDLAQSPHISIMLMVTSEHLDYHKDFEEYIDSKRNILRFQKPTDFAIINRDYPASQESDIHTAGKIYWVSRKKEVEEGCFVKDKKIFVRSNGSVQEIISASNILLPGAHNLENVCAAVMAATLLGVTKENIVGVLKQFKGLEHRLELVKVINGAKYYNDSFSTIPETAIAAIKSFKNPEIIILGGSTKNSDFTELGDVINKAENIKAIIGVGLEWPKIKSEIRNTKSEILFAEGAKDMQTIVAAASKIATSGDVVLLSPACASFDMFENYKDRGEQFKKEISKLT